MSETKRFHVTIDFPAFECDVLAEDSVDAVRYADDELYQSGYTASIAAATYTVREVFEASA